MKQNPTQEQLTLIELLENKSGPIKRDVLYLLRKYYLNECVKAIVEERMNDAEMHCLLATLVEGKEGILCPKPQPKPRNPHTNKKPFIKKPHYKSSYQSQPSNYE